MEYYIRSIYSRNSKHFIESDTKQEVGEDLDKLTNVNVTTEAVSQGLEEVVQRPALTDILDINLILKVSVVTIGGFIIYYYFIKGSNPTNGFEGGYNDDNEVHTTTTISLDTLELEALIIREIIRWFS